LSSCSTYDILYETEKLMLGQCLIMYIPHHVLSLLQHNGGYQLTSGKMGRLASLSTGQSQCEITGYLHIEYGHLAPK
jgi:hypothetical protein